MANANNSLLEQVYNVREDDQLLSQVAHVVCVLIPRGFMAAGFGTDRQLLTIHFRGYNNKKPVWDLDFFEQLTQQEPLLAAKEKVKGVFMGNTKFLVVPDELYQQNDANEWMRRLFFIEPGEIITPYRSGNYAPVYVQAMPVNITELVKINYRKADIAPLPLHHLQAPESTGIYAHCCIIPGSAFITLFSNGRLLWHNCIPCVSGEDIAFAIKQYCQQNNMDAAAIAMHCDALAGAEFPIINELTQYFKGITTGKGETISGRWDASASLAQQLLACVS